MFYMVKRAIYDLVVLLSISPYRNIAIFLEKLANFELDRFTVKTPLDRFTVKTPLIAIG